MQDFPPLDALPHALAIAVALALAACASTPTRTDPPTPAPPAPGLSVHLHVAAPSEGQFIDVQYDLADDAPLPMPLRVAFPIAWAGRDDFADDILRVDVRVPGQPDATWNVDADGTLHVHHANAQHVIVAYRLDPLRGLLTHETRFRALFDRRRFFAPGHALLAQPLDDTAEPLRVRATSSDPAWALDSSLGVPIDEIHAFDAALDAAWFAGDYRAVDTEGETGTIRVRAEPDLRVSASDLAALARRIDAAQAHLMGPDRATTVIALRRADEPSAQAGTGRRGGYVLELGGDVTAVDDDLIALLAHENLHRLIGHDIRVDGGPASATAWFLEGITDYASLLTAAREGVLPSRHFFRRIGAALWADEANPARQLDSRTRASRAWVDADAVRFGYDRGFLIGLAIDVTLRESGAGSVEGWLAFIRDDTSSRALPLTSAALRSSLERYSGTRWGPFWRAHVEGPDAPPVRALLDAHALHVVERLEPAPYLGVRWSQDPQGGWAITHVDPGSPAADAGLRVGQPLAVPPAVPDRGDARFVVQARGARVEVRVAPATGQRRVYALVEAGDEGLSALLDLPHRPPR